MKRKHSMTKRKGLLFAMLWTISLGMFAQNIKVSGNVKDDTGLDVVGVTIVVKGNATTGTTTDSKGNYILSNVPSNGSLVFSYVGMKPQTVAVNGRTSIDVLLASDNELLEEVVVVGYGSQRKSDLTGSVGQVKADAFKNQPVLSTSSALQGRIAGVSISNTSGAPGGEIKIRVRGANSVNNDNSPLIVLDGVPMGSLGLQDINPYDIAAIDVLKDASATAVFGARGANGVIIVSTKKGRSNMVSVDFKSYTSYTQPIRKYDLMNGDEYIKHANLLSGGTAFQGNYKNANTNWQDLMFNTERITQNYQLSVTGGTNQVRYYVSAFYQDQPGTLLNTNMSRGGLRNNLDFRISDKLNVGVNTYIERSYSKNTGDIGSKGNPVMASLTWNPTSDVYVGGDESKGYIRNVASPIFPNPYMGLKESNGEGYKTLGFVNLKGTYRFSEALKFESSVSVDGYFNRSGSTSNNWVSQGNMRASQGYSESFTTQNSNILTFQKKTGKHDIGAVGVFEVLQNTGRGFSANGSGLQTLTNGYDNLGLATTQGITSWYSASALMSFMGRATYGYDNRYLLTATVRRDGSSKFQGDNKWGTFPSFSIGWNVANEEFMKEQSIFDVLKVRAGWGATGSQNIAPYSTLGALNTGSYSFGTANAQMFYMAGNPKNPDLKWETSYQTNLGFDLAFLKNALTLSVDLYNKDTKDLLLFTQINKYDGGGSKLANVGEVNNKGIEAVLGYTLDTKSGFAWNTNFNIAYNKNKVISLGGDKEVFRPRIGGAFMGTETQIVRVGEPLGSFYLIPWEGIYQQDDAKLGYKAGDNKYTDKSGNNSNGFEDRTVSGSAMPKVTAGFENTFSYKGFDLSVLMQGAYGHKIFNVTYAAAAMPTSDVAYPTLREVTNYWTPQNTGAMWANPTSKTNRNYLPSTQFLQDGSYTRLKNISLGYTLPKNMTKSYGVKLYVSGQNLLTFTKYKGFDPENSSTSSSSDADAGIDLGAYPSNKTFTFGVNITFNK